MTYSYRAIKATCLPTMARELPKPFGSFLPKQATEILAHCLLRFAKLAKLAADIGNSSRLTVRRHFLTFDSSTLIRVTALHQFPPAQKTSGPVLL